MPLWVMWHRQMALRFALCATRFQRSSAGCKLFCFCVYLSGFCFGALRLYKKSIISRNTLKKVICDLVPAESFEDLEIPLKVCATELNSGKNITYDSGDLITAIIKSCSIPGIVEPTLQNKNIIQIPRKVAVQQQHLRCSLRLVRP